MVFVDFDREYLNFQDFRQNISNPARPSAFFMTLYTLFLLKNKSSRRNLGFTVENIVENIAISVLGDWIKEGVLGYVIKDLLLAQKYLNIFDKNIIGVK